MLINNKGFYNFKKLVIEPKKKYIYLTFDNDKIIKCEKERFALDISINFACKCNPPIYGELGDNNLCKKCHRIIG